MTWAPRHQRDCSARTLLRWQFHRVHELLDAAIEQIPAEALCRHRSSAAPAIAASYAQVVVSEDLAVNGVLAKGEPLALSTWVGRTGLSEMPPCIAATDWDAWGRRVRLDLARLRLYARAVYASTDAYVAALPEDALRPARAHGPGCLLSALLLTLSMRTGEIACLLALEFVPTIKDEGHDPSTFLQ
jgi:DinB superfamily